MKKRNEIQSPNQPKPELKGKILMPDGRPAERPSAPEAEGAKKEILSPIDKICSAIQRDDEELLSKIQAEIELLRKAVAERDEFLNLLQRVQADFSNYQKRIKREKEEWCKYQDEDILRELIPAFDNLDRSLSVKCDSADAKCILDGVDITKREIMRVLEKHGVSRIKTTGELFNPLLHEAIGTIQSTDHPANTILEELRAGFMLHDRVLRTAQVRVSVPPPPSSSNNPT